MSKAHRIRTEELDFIIGSQDTYTSMASFYLPRALEDLRDARRDLDHLANANFILIEQRAKLKQRIAAYEHQLNNLPALVTNRIGRMFGRFIDGK